jgi:hypothetical protein
MSQNEGYKSAFWFLGVLGFTFEIESCAPVTDSNQVKFRERVAFRNEVKLIQFPTTCM